MLSGPHRLVFATPHIALWVSQLSGPVLVSDIISFIFILWIRTGLQNPYVYRNSQIYLRNLEVKSI